MANKLLVAPAPHVHGPESTQRIMLDVIIALLPALAVSVWVFGWDVLRVTAIAILSCVALEWFIQKYMFKGKPTVGNLSAVLTGLLLSFNLPATIDWWLVVIGALVAIGIAKMSFGGLGKNPFNPALVGRVFLLIAYPVQMTSFPAPQGAADAFSGATPLSDIKMGGALAEVDFSSMLFGGISGSLGEVAALALLVGFVYLLWRKVISWHIPVAVLGTMALFAFVVALARGGDASSFWQFPLFHLLAGGAILGAVYMATDYATSPMSVCGMVVYGVGIGLITMMIRLWGAYPEGMSFAILLMNAVTPLLNKYLVPKRFGFNK